jgi:hypothetical protein
MRHSHFRAVPLQFALVVACLVASGCGASTSASHPGGTGTTSTSSTTTTGTTTTTTAPTVTPTATSVPVATPTPTSGFTPGYPVAPLTKIMLSKIGPAQGTPVPAHNSTYFPDGITLDGKNVLVVEGNINTNYTGPSSVQNWAIGVGMLSVPGGHFTAISLPGATFSNHYSYSIVPTSTYDVIEQFACGGILAACDVFSKAWAYAPATNRAQVVFPGVPLTTFVDHNIIIANDPVHGLEAANLATNTVTPLTGTVVSTNHSLSVAAFSWPYLVYTVEETGYRAFTAYAYDLQTQVNVKLPQVAPALYPAAPYQQGTFAIATGSDTLFFAYIDQSQTIDLDELDHLMQPGSMPVTVLRVPGSSETGNIDGPPIIGATAQMVAFNPYGGSGTELLWDRLNHQIYTLFQGNAPEWGYDFVSGPWFGFVGEFVGAMAVAGGADPDPYVFDLYASSGVPA